MRGIIGVVMVVLAAGGVWPVAAQAPGRPAQAPPAAPGEVRGLVVDAESRQPVSSASVEVWSHADRRLVTGTIGRPDGLFRIEGLRPGTYSLRVVMIGYVTHTATEFTIGDGNMRVNAGTVQLAKSPIVLDGVEVRAESPVVLAPDRTIYRAREVAPAAATATDILENVPSLQVDGDGKLSLRGNENVVVQINGRPAPMGGVQLANYLRQLPAGTIERVEVVPNPSARQDPEGMAGIVNIVLKQTVDLGRSGGLTLGGATSGRVAASGNFGFQGGPVTFFSTYGYNADERRIEGVNDRTRLGELRAPLGFTEQDIGGDNYNHGHNVTGNLEYRLNPRDALFSTAALNWRRGFDASLSEYTELDAGRALLDRYDRSRDASSRNRLADVAIGYRRTITPQRHELSAEVRVNRQTEDDRTLLWRMPAGAQVDESIDQYEGEANALDATIRQYTAQVDYTRPLGANWKLETGYKGNWRTQDRDFQVLKDVLGTGDWAVSDLSNSMSLDEGVNAVYGVLSGSRGPMQVQAGLRAEHATREFALGEGEAFPYDYTSLFPSGALTYTIGEGTQARLSYSRRVRRPGTQELNPFPSFFDAQNVFFGNPELGPEYTNSIEVGLQRSGRMGSVQVTPFYRHTTDVIRVDINAADTVAGREVTSITFRNLDTSRSWGADMNGQLRAGKLNGMASLNVFKIVTDGGSESSLSSDAVTWMGRLNGGYAATPGTTLQGTFFYRAPMNFENGKFSATSAVGLSVRQKLPADNAFLTLRVSDIFNANRFRAEVGDDRIIQLTDRRFSSRALHVNLQYSIGQAPRVRQQRQDQEPPPQTGFPPM
jgi:ferric enterobactin receptor